MVPHFCTAHPCPICFPTWQPSFQTQPQGCICPPTSEKTCENSFCPRKNIKISASGLAVSSPGEESDAGNGMEFFSQNVDDWGALEWFDRLAKAVRQQDAAVVAGDMLKMETCRNVAASSAMRLVRDHEQEVRAALSLSRPEGK
jgi:hypothetical protein